jgi:hypothetical protein
MSKVKIQGNASGTGVLTVTAPNTSTDRTITLPDTTGTMLDENSSLPAANLTGTVADARISALTASKLTGALPANGYWTFPETGKYKVEYVFTASMDGDSRNVYGYIGTTENNSTYYDRAALETHIQRTQSNQTLCTAYGSCIVDVTNTTNIKVKFSCFSVDTSRIMLGHSTKNRTYVTFTRIGDT